MLDKNDQFVHLLKRKSDFNNEFMYARTEQIIPKATDKLVGLKKIALGKNQV